MDGLKVGNETGFADIRLASISTKLSMKASSMLSIVVCFALFSRINISLKSKSPISNIRSDSRSLSASDASWLKPSRKCFTRGGRTLKLR